jgi:hypothetical protein
MWKPPTRLRALSKSPSNYCKIREIIYTILAQNRSVSTEPSSYSLASILVTSSSHHGERQPAAGATTAGCQRSCSCHWSADQVTQLLPEDPTSWCRLAEGQFTLCNVANPVMRYYHVLAALPINTVCLVRHVLHDVTGPKSYDRL